jgi:hypothetical protein
VIRQLRELDMPLDQIQAVLTAPDVRARNERLAAHLARLEEDLDRTQRAVRALGDLLTRDSAGPTTNVDLGDMPALPAAVISEVVAAEDAVGWLQGALGELHATLAAQELPSTGHAGGTQTIPAGEFAILTHCGPPTEVDRTYAALAAHVARHSVAVEGPIREYYLVGQRDTADSRQWRTEIAWPVFLTSARDSVAQ